MNQPCLKSELTLFNPPLTQVTHERALWVDIYPLTSLEGNGPIEFCFSGSANEYIDLNDTVLYLKMKVVKSDGTNLTPNTAAAFVAPANLLLATMFSDVSLVMNDSTVEGGNHLYPYKAYMSTLLQYGREAKTTQLELSGYHEDVDERKKWLDSSRVFELMGPLHLDMFLQSKYLLPGVTMRVKLSRSKADFVFANNAGTANFCKAEIQKACLYIRKVKVNPTVLYAHEKGLETMNAIYPIQQSEMVTYTISAGSSYHMQDNLFYGQIPKLLIVGLVKNTVFAGDARTNPMTFEHFDINYLSLQRDGESVPYNQPLQPDFTNGLVAQTYMSMIQGLEMYNHNEGNAISLGKFMRDNTLFVFNLTPDLNAGGSVGQPYRSGNLRLEMKFKNALPQSINVVMLAIRDGRVEITKTREVMKS